MSFNEGFLAGLEEFVNSKGEKLYRPAMKTIKFKNCFCFSFYAFFALIEKDDRYAKIMAFIIRRMNLNNILVITNRKISEHLGTSESRIAERLKSLVKMGVIIKQKKKIMFNPMFVCKTSAQKQQELIKIWMNGELKEEDGEAKKCDNQPEDD